MADILNNPKARRDYNILETFEAGIVLHGTEVKALRAGKGQISDAFARVEKDEVFLYNAHIDEYSHANIAFHQAIIRLSGSHLMGKTIENLFIHVRAMRRLTISQSDRAARSIVDHMRIIEALERRDTELAERLVRDHSLDLAAFVEKNCDFLE